MQSLRLEDAGRYVCIVSNEAGTTRDSAQLTVNGMSFVIFCMQLQLLLLLLEQFARVINLFVTVNSIKIYLFIIKVIHVGTQEKYYLLLADIVYSYRKYCIFCFIPAQFIASVKNY